MTTQFFCKNRDRWKQLLAQNPATINGIDYLEVFSDDQKTLRVHFLFELPGVPDGVPHNPLLMRENIIIEGGVRIKNIKVEAISVKENRLTVTVDQPGDFSTYTLRIIASETDVETPPDGFDQQLSSIDFSFKVNCPNEFDCKKEEDCHYLTGEEPDINYLAKDYATFKRLMLDRMSVIVPGWQERNAADLQIATLEILAYTADYLSYYQDAVATEAYLHTARKRISLKRHARLLDYFVHDGCNARTWVYIGVDPGGGADGAFLKKGTIFLTSGEEGEAAVNPLQLPEFLNRRKPVAFESMHSITLHSELNEIPFYTWGDSDCCLPKGAVMATLVDTTNGKSYGLNAGDILVFEEIVNPVTGQKADADPDHRHAVRLSKVRKITDKLTNVPLIQVEWFEEDALPFSLRLSSTNDNGIITNVCIARGNLVMADHGITQAGEGLYPEMALTEKIFYPKLKNVANLTCSEEYDNDRAKGSAATKMVLQNPHRALPAVWLYNNQEVWNAKKDLLGSDRFATEFVVETSEDGSSWLRFGDNVNGKKPQEGFRPAVSYRVGNGGPGNVGRDTINIIVSGIEGIGQIRNPLAAIGGVDAETMEEVRQFAPRAFRTQERAVTEKDYKEKTELHPEVQNAVAKFYWTGSWYTVYLIIDRKGGKEIDETFKQQIKTHLEKYRMAGYDLEIRPPKYIPLEITMSVCVKRGYFKTDIKQKLLQLFSNDRLSNGKTGFFHPDNFVLGQPLYLSALYETAMKVDGVVSVEVLKFKKWSEPQRNEIRDALLKVGELEVIRLDNDPNFPENGKIEFIISGGL